MMVGRMTPALRAAIALTAIPSALALTAAQASAHECMNASKKNQAAGVQLVLNDADEIVWMTKGLENRIAQGIVDPETGEGFSGLVGFDIDGDGAADLATYIVGPNGEIPLQAQFNGATCQGIINIGTWFEECMAGAEPV